MGVPTAKAGRDTGLENFNDVKAATLGQSEIVQRNGRTEEKLNNEVFVLNRVSKMKRRFMHSLKTTRSHDG